MLSFLYTISLILILFMYNKMRLELKTLVKQNEQLKTENKQLHEYMFIDELTGVGNCVRYIQKINEMIDEFRRYERIFSILMIRVNNCNLKNKSSKIIIDAIKKQVRKSDLIARFNEDTLIILLPNTQLRNSIIFANKIKTLIDNFLFDTDDKFSMIISVDTVEADDTERTLYHRLEDHILLDFFNTKQRIVVRWDEKKLNG